MSKEEKEAIKVLKKDINSLNIEELTERVVGLFRELRRAHKALSSLNEEVQLWARRNERPVRIIRRDFKPVDGWLYSTSWELREVTMNVLSREKDYGTGLITIEAKTVSIPHNMIVQSEEIHERTQEEEESQP